ncbi:hypothetical protein N7510_006925 [Penicillium lagena]|uniref:uncharacterized protein n=1 Tax=Penicillium lagena TaxID=94218 RepID=UPI002541CCFC|nr:uncharacterized protein N7510_006925 [Penicillium lagena]KAJ5610206.1 hypothetical protein N7510_006925 [Penicillium lagena]
MSDFFRRASEAFHQRQRQGSSDSTDSTNAPTSPDAKKLPEQEPLNQKSESAQPDSHVNEAFAGTATGNVAGPKRHRYWGWGQQQGNKPGTEQQHSQEQRDNTDWVIGS